MTMTDERLIRMGIAAAQDAGDLSLARLLRERGVQSVWSYARSGKGSTGFAQRAMSVDLNVLARRTQAIGARFVIPSDSEWPTQVDQLAWTDPVGRLGGEPVGLWVRGPARLCDAATGVAVVGSRASTTYGEHVAGDWATELARAHRAVVSGGAYGIDACAHRGSLAAEGVTVAVMAGGLAQLYPSGNSALLQAVASTGAVVSEYPPDRPPSRARFLVRNRLIAALSGATVVVEAALRSGAQNTASWAGSLGRLLLAVPGPVTSAMSVTPHRLIRSGQATLVSSVSDVLEAMKPLDASTVDEGREKPSRFDGLTEIQKQVQEALPVRRGVCVDQLALRLSSPALPLLVCLAQLEQLGFARQSEPGWWTAVATPRS
ncbi:MAG: DNA-processing protein DprA [Propionibacteriaceae bacterium]|jgi:DNA processing protein|nr:DNA-processing protein DprA [Propionibacteriaceae bacterium]